MAYTHYKNGEWVGDDQLNVSVYDLSVLRGYGIFDFFRTYNRKFLDLNKNLVRFLNSARILQMEIPLSKKQLEEVLAEGLKRNPNGDLNIRLLLTGGVSKDYITPGKPSLFILFSESSLLPAGYYRDGVKVVTEPTPRTHAKAKSLNYLAAVIAMKLAKKRGAFEILYIDPLRIEQPKVYECSTSNFFAVIDNVLVTPKEDVLLGITRHLVIELAKTRGLKVSQRNLLVEEIPNFQEAFLAASNKGVVPIVKIDGEKIGTGKPGSVTKKLLTGFRQLTKSL